MAANMDNSKPPHGVYKNLRLMHACTTIVGFTVHLQTNDGSVWEGIFNTFSPDFTICLDLAIQIDPKLNSKDCLYAALKSGSKAKKQAFFDLKDIVRITVVDVDLNYATKDLAKLTTDADISGYDANKSAEHRQLESWQDDDADNVNAELSLDDFALAGNKNDSQNKSRGWAAHEMFLYNERVHKVTTTYDENLTDYTVPLPNHNTKEWRKKKEHAAAVAKEIEGSTKSQSRLAKEDDGDCEEEKFSAVLRPAQNRPTSSNKAHNTDTTDCGQENNRQTGSAGNSVLETQHQQSLQHQQHRPSPPRQSHKDDSSSHHQDERQHHHQSQQLQHHHHPSPHQQHQLHAIRLQGRQQHRDADQHDDKPNISSGAQPGQSQSSRSAKDDKGDEDNKYNLMQRPMPNRGNSGNQNGTHKNFRQGRYDNRSKVDSSLRNFGKQLNLAPSPRQPQNQNPNQVQNQLQNTSSNQNQPLSHQQPQQKQPQQQPQQTPSHQLSQHQQPPPQQHQQQPSAQQTTQQPQAQAQITVTTASPATATTTPTVNTSTISERSDTSSIGGQAKDYQSELARKSTLNPNAKEFVYKPRSPASNQGSQTNGANQASTSGAATIDPANSSPMSQPPHASYYQQVPMFPHGLSPHQQQHHAAQFITNHTHPHFQNQIHYMSPVPQHFAQQMSQRYIRSNFQNYHHRGEHHNNVRPDYSQASMMAPTSTGQPFVPSPSGAPHPMNAYAASPQQPMIYSGPPQSMYPMVQAGFPQHMPHVMPNPPPYDGSTVYMPSQNYIVNP